MRNNAAWCAAVCRSHDIPAWGIPRPARAEGTFGTAAWWSPRRTPPYYPDAVTLCPDAGPAAFLARIDTASPGCTVKDSYATLDLTSHGFVGLFAAQWIHRAAGLPLPDLTPLRAVPVTTGEGLHAWQTAWHGDDAPDVFRPALLDDPSVAVLAFAAGEHLAGGVVLNRAAGAVGLSNLFAAEGVDPGAVRSAAITAACRRFPGLPLVGYEQGADLALALDAGFRPLGDLRVWLHDS